MAQQTAPEDEPASNWDHSHVVEAGDRFEVDGGEHWDIVNVHPDGSVRAVCVEFDDAETWSEKGVTNSLANGDMVRVSDGKSHELASF